MAGDNPLARDIRVALGKANEVFKYGGDLPALCPEKTPRLFRGSYGIGSRDFRPEHSLGAYEFAIGQTRRTDGKGAADGETYFTLGIDHPYAVISKDTPSLSAPRTTRRCSIQGECSSRERGRRVQRMACCGLRISVCTNRLPKAG